jgi:sialic acid synthase SpsE/quercetin dioxygenase-like cupin family protein
MQSIEKLVEWPKPLIIADLANNHTGDVGLAREIILELSQLQREFDFRIAVKFQYRDLDSYIHPSFKGDKSHKYVSRFESTKLEWDDFALLTRFANANGLLTAATPFDENSVEKVKEHQHDFLKIASASSNDWILLEKAASQNLPMVVSTGGLNDYEIEKIVTFLRHRGADFALMHCVAIYPTADENLNLSRIRYIKDKFKVTVGYSTHENPDNLTAGPLAVASGAEILERHYAKSKPGSTVNSYSSEKQEFQFWLQSLLKARRQLHDKNFIESLKLQKSTLRELQRGVYASSEIKKGELINQTNTFAAFPAQGDQLITNDISIRKDILCIKDLSSDYAINYSGVNITNKYQKIEEILSFTRELILEAGIPLNHDLEVEISHHYGLEEFESFGAILIPILNREYAKKLVVMRKNQTHPEHYHDLKEETFFVFKGSIKVVLNNIEHILNAGEVLVIPRRSKHSMFAIEDCIFEEISSTNLPSDSFYTDSEKLADFRKTAISLWL